MKGTKFCARCRFWEPTIDQDYDEDAGGPVFTKKTPEEIENLFPWDSEYHCEPKEAECRRFPPNTFIQHITTWSPNKDGDDHPLSESGMALEPRNWSYPITAWDNICGEFQPIEESQG